MEGKPSCDVVMVSNCYGFVFVCLRLHTCKIVKYEIVMINDAFWLVMLVERLVMPLNTYILLLKHG